MTGIPKSLCFTASSTAITFQQGKPANNESRQIDRQEADHGAQHSKLGKKDSVERAFGNHRMNCLINCALKLRVTPPRQIRPNLLSKHEPIALLKRILIDDVHPNLSR